MGPTNEAPDETQAELPHDAFEEVLEATLDRHDGLFERLASHDRGDS